MMGMNTGAAAPAPLAPGATPPANPQLEAKKKDPFAQLLPLLLGGLGGGLASGAFGKSGGMALGALSPLALLISQLDKKGGKPAQPGAAPQPAPSASPIFSGLTG